MLSQSSKDSPEKQLEKLLVQLQSSNKAMQKIIEKNRAKILEKSDCQDDLESLRAPDILKTNNTPGKKE